jgi:hypothetical protein
VAVAHRYRGLGGRARRTTGGRPVRAAAPARRRTAVADGIADLFARSAAYVLSVLGLLYVVELAMAPR